MIYLVIIFIVVLIIVLAVPFDNVEKGRIDNRSKNDNHTFKF